MKAFSIFDRATEAYSAPFFQPTNNAAIRMFTDEANREGSQINAHPADFELYIVGEFSEERGLFLDKINKERLARAEDVKREA